MPGKCLFQDCWLKGSAYQEWDLKDNLDKHYAQCLPRKIQLILCVCVCVSLTVVMVLNIGRYKVLIFALVQVPGNHA